ncbi:hypothetical protein MLD38_019159 [Melastoma candidum]|uniref:Uncharacterized protein n=1 Tax=Melastoma candidum TaxID=119954 RepID=A0ACB9QW15_9MYRT|nr:hypothetical protein MLD38_019159 [Melastoma candidum]
MSGGQKQRIQIARSCSDAHTGSQLFSDCLMGILKDKTILYVTHQVEFLPAADLILVMQDGKIAQTGKFEDLLKHSKGFKALVGAHNEALESILTVENSSRASQKETPNGGLDREDLPTDEPHRKRNVAEENQPLEISEKGGKLVQDEERGEGKHREGSLLVVSNYGEGRSANPDHNLGAVIFPSPPGFE